MGKFLKKIQDTYITGFYSIQQTAIMNHYKDQPNNGPTIYAFENPETKITRSAFVDKSEKFEYDDETEFTWRIGYNNGHPCVFITFTNIKENLIKDCNAIICLETNTNTKGKNKSLNAFDYNLEEDIIYFASENEEITWYYLDSISLNKEYIIYIKGNSNFGKWKIAENENLHRPIPDDWKIDINIRPTIRFLEFGTTITSFLTNYKCLPKYQKISYLLKDEI